MAESTTPTVAQAIAADRDALIARYASLQEAHEAARAKGPRGEQAMRSLQGSMSVTSFKISETELEMEIEGVDYTPWVKPVAAHTRAVFVPQAEIEDKLAKLGKVFKTTKHETAKASADRRITALLKKAEKQDMQVSDPRK